MAGINEPRRTRAAHAGLFSRLARRQYAALAAICLQMLANSARSIQGILDLGASGTAFVMFSSTGLALGCVFGAVSFSMALHAEWYFLPGIFWGLFLLWQLVLVAMASFQQQFDLGGLLRFPVSFWSFYCLNLIFGSIEVSTLLGGLCCLGIWVGIMAARPDLFFVVTLVLAAFAAFNIVLVRILLVWIGQWLSQRRTREILGAAFVLVLLVLELFSLHVFRPSGMHPAPGGADNNPPVAAREAHSNKAARTLEKYLPPGLAASALKKAAEQKPAAEAVSLGLLGLYLAGAGGLLASRLRAEYRGENLGQAPAETRSEQREGRQLVGGSGPVAAVIEKELQILSRSVLQLFSLAMSLVMVVIIASFFSRSIARTGHPMALALPMCLTYSLLSAFTHFAYNNLGAEGAGIQVFFLSPTPIRTVLLAKNLFHAILFGLTALVTGVQACLFLGWPGPQALAATVAWFLFALPANLAVGNLVSIAMPHRVNLGRVMQEPGARAGSIIAMVLQGLILGVGAGVFELCLHFSRLWLATPILLALAAGAVSGLLAVLRYAGSMANRNRDMLLSVLVRTA